jgi:N-acetylmuramoyl-L-alanine amidase
MKRSITLDAGHGGNDSGAVGLKGLREKDVALAVTLRLGAMLTAAGLAVNYTRKDDRFLELHERSQIANEARTDVFLSIHCNSASKRAASGFEVFTTPGQTAADVFATCLFMDYARRFPSKLKRIDDTDGDPDKEANFAVLRLTKAPAALFELDFISSPTVEAWLAEPLNQIAMAEALCDGVLRFFEMVPVTGVTPVTPSTPSLKERLRNLSTQLANLAEEAP